VPEPPRLHRLRRHARPLAITSLLEEDLDRALPFPVREKDEQKDPVADEPGVEQRHHGGGECDRVGGHVVDGGLDRVVQTCPVFLPPGLPAQLLVRRPDVALAEQTVVATNARIGVATAEFYPRFMLMSSAGFESANLATLFNWQSRVASISPSISIPIFQGGRLRANLSAPMSRDIARRTSPSVRR